MTTERTLTISSLALLATAATTAVFAFATATPTPRHVVQSPTPTLADARAGGLTWERIADHFGVVPTAPIAWMHRANCEGGHGHG